jgi:hypothetical protein
MIERGTTSRQRVVRSPIEDFPKACKKAGVEPPALFVIGPAVKYADKLDWFGSRPLSGERVIVVAPAGAVRESLEAEGADVVDVPLPVTPAARIVMGALPLSGCVFRNVDEVDALDEERDGQGWGVDMVAWCLHPDAAARARDLGWKHVEEIDAPEDLDVLVAAMARRQENGSR